MKKPRWSKQEVLGEGKKKVPRCGNNRRRHEIRPNTISQDEREKEANGTGGTGTGKGGNGKQSLLGSTGGKGHEQEGLARKYREPKRKGTSPPAILTEGSGGKRKKDQSIKQAQGKQRDPNGNH